MVPTLDKNLKLFIKNAGGEIQDVFWQCSIFQFILLFDDLISPDYALEFSMILLMLVSWVFVTHSKVNLKVN